MEVLGEGRESLYGWSDMLIAGNGTSLIIWELSGERRKCYVWAGKGWSEGCA